MIIHRRNAGCDGEVTARSTNILYRYPVWCHGPKRVPTRKMTRPPERFLPRRDYWRKGKTASTIQAQYPSNSDVLVEPAVANPPVVLDADAERKEDGLGYVHVPGHCTR